jgi:CelD/BcsL family acetyltransferase involved in cellulose biosynthesis
MHVQRFSSLDSLRPLRDAWRDLSRGAPMMSPAWLENWWRAYGGSSADSDNVQRRLYVVGVFDDAGQLAALAPWYLDRSKTQGRVLRFLGSGEVCSDHLSVLCRKDCTAAALGSLADWLAAQAEVSGASDSADRWDLLELTGVDADDPAIVQLATAMQRRGHGLHHRPAVRCWRLELPSSWDEYLARLSKGHRKQVRRMVRDLFASGRAELHTLEDERQIDNFLDTLIDLHQRRRRSIGQPGCFASRSFSRFVRSATPELWREGLLGLHVLKLDDRPIAAEYQIRGDGEIFAYQSGVDPERLDVQPGNLSAIATIRQAIDQGYRGLDFLRGDEAYKSHWGAEPFETCELRIVAPHATARLRHAVWAAGVQVRQAIGRRMPRRKKPDQHDTRSRINSTP